MSCLRDRLPPPRQGLHADRSEKLVRPLHDQVSDGDIIMVKGSLGTNMAPIVTMLLRLDENSLGKEQI